MNELFQKLIIPAKFMAEKTFNRKISASPELYAFAEKFAELIVRECIEVAINKNSGIINTADIAGYVAAGRLEAARMIKQHFGVEG